MELAHSKIDRKLNWIENHGSSRQASRKTRHHGESYNTVDARNSKVRIAILFFLSQLYQCQGTEKDPRSIKKRGCRLRSECPSSCKGSKRLEKHILWRNMDNRATEFRFIWRFVHISECLHDPLNRKIDKMKVSLYYRILKESNDWEFRFNSPLVETNVYIISSHCFDIALISNLSGQTEIILLAHCQASCLIFV